VTTAIQSVGSYLEAFVEFSSSAVGHDLGWLRSLREEAFARFSELGLPTTRNEDWRFTNIAEIARTNFSLPHGASSEVPDAEWRPSLFDGAGIQLVFVNGRFAPAISSRAELPAGVTVSSLKQEIGKGSKLVASHLGRYLDSRRDAFCALNTAFTEDGAFIHIAPGIVVEAPIRLLFVSTETDSPLMMHPRNLVLIEREAQAQIMEEYVSVGRGTVLANSATELVAGESSTVSHYMIEREHEKAFNISTLRIQQERSANVASHSVLLGGGLVRNNIHPVLAGEGGECLINGLFIGSGRQHHDNYMYVEHASPHSSSRQFYNGILDEAAHGVFHGRIVVHKDAQKTDAKQTNRNLLLSDDAQIDTKPQLEIYADDVKCTHGATIGQLEENALFYLRSRGIDEVSARSLLLAAFAHECVDRMRPGTARNYAERLIEAHLSSMAHRRQPQAGRTGGQGARHWEEVG